MTVSAREYVWTYDQKGFYVNIVLSSPKDLTLMLIRFHTDPSGKQRGASIRICV